MLDCILWYSQPHTQLYAFGFEILSTRRCNKLVWFAGSILSNAQPHSQVNLVVSAPTLTPIPMNRKTSGTTKTVKRSKAQVSHQHFYLLVAFTSFSKPFSLFPVLFAIVNLNQLCSGKCSI